MKNLRDVCELELFTFDYSNTVPHIFPVKVVNSSIKNELMAFLKSNQIETGEHYYPNHRHQYFKMNQQRIVHFPTLTNFTVEL